MILAIDVHYQDDSAIAAGVLFESWHSQAPWHSVTVKVDEVAPYQPGAFYKRELPCILALLQQINAPLQAIVIDGFVSLGSDEKPGLGMHLYQALHQATPVIGVAKKSFKDTPQSCQIFRGNSSKPLFVTAVGIDVQQARKNICDMHGKYRLPTLLKQVDSLCRSGSKACTGD